MIGERISTHISWNEATKSSTAIKFGIDNTPGARELKNMKELAEAIFEPIRNHFGIPIKIEAFFRCRALNNKVSKSQNSQHIFGEAIDLDDDFGGLKNSDIFYFVVKNLEWDQIVWEYGDKENPAWVHISYKKGANRKRITIARKINGFDKYIHFETIEEFELYRNSKL